MKRNYLSKNCNAYSQMMNSGESNLDEIVIYASRGIGLVQIKHYENAKLINITSLIGNKIQ